MEDDWSASPYKATTVTFYNERSQSGKNRGAAYTSNRQIFKVLTYTLLINLTSFMTASYMAPFYTREADIREMTHIEKGLIFCLSGLTYTFSSQLSHWILSKKICQTRWLLAQLNILLGVCDTTLGALRWINNNLIFLLLTLALRGLSMIATMLIRVVLTDRVSGCSNAKYVKITSNLTALCAFIVGPVLGGFIYEEFGFPQLFFEIGGVTVALSLLAAGLDSRCSPTMAEQMPPRHELALTSLESTSTGIMEHDGCHDYAFITSSAVLTSTLSYFALLPVLQTYLTQELNLVDHEIGLIFMIPPTAALLACFPIFHLVNCTPKYGPWTMICGLSCSALQNLFVFPPPNLPVYSNYYPGYLWAILIGNVCVGASAVCVFVPGFLHLSKQLQNASRWASYVVLTFSVMPAAAPMVCTILMQWFRVPMGSICVGIGLVQLGLVATSTGIVVTNNIRIKLRSTPKQQVIKEAKETITAC